MEHNEVTESILLKKRESFSFNGFSVRKQYLLLFIIAFALALSFFLPSMIADGGPFLFYGDYNVQQIPFYYEVHEAVRNGDIFWNWNTDTGASLIGSYTYYMLGSPFFWLSLLFPTSTMPYLMPILLCLKFALSALTAFAYLKLFVRKTDTAVLGALMYAFSSHAVYSIFFNQFNEVFVFFPLMLYGMEILIKQKKRGIFALGVALCALCNYYLFVAEVVFLVIYFVIRLLSGGWKNEFRLSTFADLAFESVIGFGMTAFLVLPGVWATAEVPRSAWKIGGWGAILYNNTEMYPTLFASFFQPPDLPARPSFYPNVATKWSSVAAWLPLFSACGTICYLRHRRKKDWVSKVIIVLLVMSVVPVFNSMFQLFSSSYYTRWFFMLVLIMVLATCLALEKCRTEEWRGAFKITLAATALLSLPVGLVFNKIDPEKDFSYFIRENGLINGFIKFYDTYGLIEQVEKYWVYILMMIVFLLLLYYVMFSIGRKHRKFFPVTLGCLCVVISLYSNVYIHYGKTYEYQTDKFIEQNIINKDLFELPEEEQFVRIDVAKNNRDNQGLLLGLPSIQFFHTVVPRSTTLFYESLGSTRTVKSEPGTEYEWLRSMLSVKYLIDARDQTDVGMDSFELIGESQGFNIWENRNYIPMGFTYDSYITFDQYEGQKEEYRDNILLHGILLTDEQIEKYSSILPYNDIYIDYSSIDSPDEDEELERLCAQRRENTVDGFWNTSRGFGGSITLDSPNLVFFSVPYEAGWTAYVNGEKAEIENVNVGFMAVLCDEGESVITFEYTAPYLIEGCVITIISVLLFAVYIVVMYLLYDRKRNGPAAVVPALEQNSEDAEEADVLRADIAESQNEPEYLDDESDEENDIIEE